MSETLVAQRNDRVALKAKDRSFMLLLAGSSVSMLGTRMSTIAFPMLVLWLTRSPVAAGWTAFAATAPSVLAYVPAGALVDRWRPRLVMLLSEFGRGAVIAAVAVALLLSRPNISFLIIAAVIEETLEVFSTLAERRYVSSLMEHEQVPSRLVQIEARTHVVVMAGRPLGGFLFAVMPPLPFLADAISFAISVTALISIKSRQAAELIASLWTRDFSSPLLKRARHEPQDRVASDAPSAPSHSGLWNDIREGLHWLHEDCFTRITIVLSAGTTFICQALIMIFLAAAHSHGLSSAAIGIALAASGLGGALGSVAAYRFPAPASRPWTIIRRCGWIIASVLLMSPAGPSFPCIAGVMGILAFTGALGNVELGTYLIQNVAEDMLARVTSVGRLVSFGACAIGPVLGGLMIENYNIKKVALMVAVAIIGLTLFSFLMPSAHRDSRIGQLSSTFLRSAALGIIYAVLGSWTVLRICATQRSWTALRYWTVLRAGGSDPARVHAAGPGI